jgi:hypothetical protein
MKDAQSDLPTKTKNLLLRSPIMKDPTVKGPIKKGVVRIGSTMESPTTIFSMEVV